MRASGRGRRPRGQFVGRGATGPSMQFRFTNKKNGTLHGSPAAAARRGPLGCCPRMVVVCIGRRASGPFRHHGAPNRPSAPDATGRRAELRPSDRNVPTVRDDQLRGFSARQKQKTRQAAADKYLRKFHEEAADGCGKSAVAPAIASAPPPFHMPWSRSSVAGRDIRCRGRLASFLSMTGLSV